MILIRYLLIGLIVYLIVRSFIRFNESATPQKPRADTRTNSKTPGKKVSKKVGEYIDYEEIKK